MDANQIDPQTQKMLNEPVVNPKGLSSDDQAFLNMVLDKVDRKEVDLLRPSTLINHAAYDKLTPEAQGKVDFDGVNLCSTLRNIYDLWKFYQQPTYQIENLVHQLRVTKERLEEISGDVYLI